MSIELLCLGCSRSLNNHICVQEDIPLEEAVKDNDSISYFVCHHCNSVMGIDRKTLIMQPPKLQHLKWIVESLQENEATVEEIRGGIDND